MRLTSLFTFLCLTFMLKSQQNIEIFRNPSLSPDGSAIAFSYQEDIWTVSSEGGKAYRLTIHEAYESDPQWSPDGKQILFASERNGNADLYVIDVDGHNLRRLTFHSANDQEGIWNGNEEIYFTSRRNYVQVERESSFYKIAATGGTPERFMDVLGSSPAVSANHNMLAFVKGSGNKSREAYRGSANKNIWLYLPDTGKFAIIASDDAMEIRPRWGKETELYYLSAKSGKYNIYKTTIDKSTGEASEPLAITDYKDEGIRNFDIAADGRSIVYIHGVDIIHHNLESGESNKVKIQVTKDYRFDPIKRETLSSGIAAFEVSPDEKQIAFEAKGDIFFKPNDKEKNNSINPLSNPSNDINVRWLSNEVALFLSDRNGNYDIYSIGSSDPNQQHILKSFKWEIKSVYSSPAEELSFELSPDRSKIAIIQEPGKLLVGNIDSTGLISEEKVLLDGWATPNGIVWSPDGNWLAYALQDLNFNSEIFIIKADGSIDPVNVSMHPRTDSSPVWSRDGSKLGFLSIRNHGDTDVWFAWLRKKDWEKTTEDWKESDDDKPAEKENSKDSKTVNPIVIDLDGIHNRLVQVTSMPGNEGNLVIDGTGEWFLFSTNNRGRDGSGGKQEYKKVKWNGDKLENLLPDGDISNVQLDKKGSTIYYNSKGKLAMATIEGGKVTQLPFSAKMEIPVAEYRKQVFDEGWRTINSRFYDPNFHGQNWQSLRDRYEPRAIAASTQQDFQMIFNEMLGQLNASHMGLRTSNPEELQNEITGLIGVELINHPEGVKITSIVPGSPADKEESKLYIGEIIQKVNNERVDPDMNFYSLMNNKANEKVLLEVINSSGNIREIIIRPKSSLVNEKYEAWVEMNKRLTDYYSNGRLGYIHIQGMNWPSFERFERELMASGYGKEGIVIDVRFNGGGWTTDMIMAVINVRQHAYTVPRGATDNLEKNHRDFKEYYPFGERLPMSSLTKPSVALCNEDSYSNAEIFAHAYKSLGLGKLVGQPTNAAVISTGSKTLMDGSTLRVPARGWFAMASEENMELVPAIPDYIVTYSPESKGKKEDEQLKKAVEVLLESL